MPAEVTWIGHAATLVEIDGVRVLADPLLTRRIGHLRRRGPLPDADVRRTDVVVISHAHADHLHRRSLKRVAEASPRVPVVVPRGAERYVAGLGLGPVLSVSPGDRLEVAGVVLEVTEAAHTGGRGRRDKGSSETVGYVVERSDRRCYLAGDTDLFDGMSAPRAHRPRGHPDRGLVEDARPRPSRRGHAPPRRWSGSTPPAWCRSTGAPTPPRSSACTAAWLVRPRPPLRGRAGGARARRPADQAGTGADAPRGDGPRPSFVPLGGPVSGGGRWRARRPCRGGAARGPGATGATRPTARAPAPARLLPAQRGEDRHDRRDLLGRRVRGEDLEDRRLAFGSVRSGPPFAACVRGPSGPTHSGMFPCFFGGSVSRLVRSSRSDRTISRRVSWGAITAST